MRHRTSRWPGLVGLALLSMASAAATHAQRRPSTHVQAKVFKSRAALKAALGEPIAQQVPQEFSFDLFALVWVKLPVDPAARVKIVTLPAETPLRHSHSGALWMQLTRAKTTLKVEIVTYNPCQGGQPPPPGAAAECRQRLEAGLQAAKQTQVLFATPRARLRRVIATRSMAPPRP